MNISTFPWRFSAVKFALALFLAGGLHVLAGDPQNTNQAPEVRLTFPPSSVDMSIDSPMIIRASAVDYRYPTLSTMVHVRFYADSQLIGISTNPPYGVVWRAVPTTSGGLDVKLTAVAEDNGVLMATSSPPAVVHIDDEINLPNVTIVAPRNGAILPEGMPVHFEAALERTDGSGNPILFYVDNRLVATVTDVPYGIVLPRLPVGQHQLRVDTTDYFGMFGRYGGPGAWFWPDYGTTVTVTVTHGLSRGDLNQDNIPDLLFQDSSGFLAAWLMQNSTNLDTAQFLDPNQVSDTGYRVVGSADFNGDGKEDLLFQHTDGTLAVWLMDGLSLSEAKFLSPRNPGESWRVVGTGLIDRDDHPDIVFQNDNGALAVWYLDGLNLKLATLLSPASPGGSGWQAAGVGDLDGDQNPDLIFQRTDGTLAVWFLSGTTLRQASLLNPPNPGLGWHVAAVTDLNRDGKADLILQNTNLDLAVWLMNGANRVSSYPLNPNNSGASWELVGPK